MQGKPGRRQTAMFAILGVLLVANLWATMGVDRTFEKVIQRVTVEHTSMTTEWRSKGVDHKITTHLGERNPLETESEHGARHRGMSAIMLRFFPRGE